MLGTRAYKFRESCFKSEYFSLTDHMKQNWYQEMKEWQAVLKFNSIMDSITTIFSATTSRTTTIKHTSSNRSSASSFSGNLASTSLFSIIHVNKFLFHVHHSIKAKQKKEIHNADHEIHISPATFTSVQSV